MNKLLELWKNFINKKNTGIYWRTLRLTLWGSFLTFAIMGSLFLLSMLTVHNVLSEQSESVSENVSEYIDLSSQNEIKHHLNETAVLKSKLVTRILKNCSYSVEFLASKMTEILQNKEDHKPKQLPIANFVSVPDDVAYVYYGSSLMKKGISDKVQDEIAYASSIEDDMRRINRGYYQVIVTASKQDWIIRLDMLHNDDKGAILSQDEFKQGYSILEKPWFKEGINKGQLIYTNPYMASYGKPCISICAPYENENGIAGLILVDIDTNYILERIKNNYVQNGEFSFIMGRNGEILMSHADDGTFAVGDMTEDLRNSDDEALADAARRMTSGEIGATLVKADGVEYYLAYAPINDTGWSIGSVIAKEEIIKGAKEMEKHVKNDIESYGKKLDVFFATTILIALALFIALLCFIVKKNMRTAKDFATPIQLLTEGANEIARGNLNKRIEIKTGDEIETLANTFNGMTKELALYMKNLKNTAAQNERIKTELSLGTRIQSGMLPKGQNPFPNRKDFDLSALMQPAREVGGDFYDFYLMDENHLVITVADVSDKGVPAALFMVIAKTILKETLLYTADTEKLSEVFKNANNALTQSNDEGMFVTVFTGILNISTGEFVYANAGHNPPIIRSGENCAYLPKALNTIMGVIEGLEFKIAKLTLKKGDALFFYTDGVTEARDKKNGFFGEDRLLIAVQNFGANAQTDISNVYKAVKDYTKDAQQSDDITMLEVIYKGKE